MLTIETDGTLLKGLYSLPDLAEITGYSVTSLLLWQGELAIVPWRLRSGRKLFDQTQADRLIEYADTHDGRQHRALSRR